MMLKSVIPGQVGKRGESYKGEPAQTAEPVESHHEKESVKTCWNMR